MATDPRRPRSGKLVLRIAAMLVGLGIVLAMPATMASAAPAPDGGTTVHITGDCGTTLVKGTTVRTSSAGSIKLKYTNGMGSLISNYTKLRISAINHATGAVMGTALVGPSTGGTYTIVGGVPVGTTFTLNFRAETDPGVDHHWEGDLTY